jgi:hypothetical protein
MTDRLAKSRTLDFKQTRDQAMEFPISTTEFATERSNRTDVHIRAIANRAQDCQVRFKLPPPTGVSSSDGWQIPPIQLLSGQEAVIRSTLAHRQSEARNRFRTIGWVCPP